MYRRPHLLARVLVLVAALAVAGCSSAEEGGVVWTAPSTAAGSAPAETTPAALSRAEAAQRYLAAVRPYNEALEALEDAVNSGQPLATQRDLATRTAEALEQEMAELRAVPWPSDVAPHIETLLEESEQALPHWRRAAEAASVDELVAAVTDAAEFSGAETAATIRELLQLDAYDEDDY